MKDLEQAKIFLDIAARDYRALCGMEDPETFSDEIFGFHVQQAVEKSLKAWDNKGDILLFQLATTHRTGRSPLAHIRTGALVTEKAECPLFYFSTTSCRRMNIIAVVKNRLSALQLLAD